MSRYDGVEREWENAVQATYLEASRSVRAGNEPAAALYCKAAEVLLQVEALLQEAKAISIWADQQRDSGPFLQMTVFNEEDEKSGLAIQPVLYWDYDVEKLVPAWEVTNSPLQDSGKDAWKFLIDEEAKAKGILTVKAVVYTEFDGVGTVCHQVPVLEGVAVPSDDPRRTWGPSQWAEFIKPIAESHVASTPYKPAPRETADTSAA